MSNVPQAGYPPNRHKLLEWTPGLPTTGTYILREHKVMYVSVAKNACTSLKWMLAELSGQDTARFHGASDMQSDVAHTIHRRWLWQDVPGLRQLTPQELAGLHPDDGWFVFGVVRNPYERLFSAWQSKLLNRDPGYLRYRDQPFYPELPTSTADVVREFARFVRYLDDEPDHPIATRDVHFRPQAEMLVVDKIPYSRIYDVRQLDQLLIELQAHLTSVGKAQRLVLPRENSTPLSACQILFDNGVRELVEKRYAVDFDQFGGFWSFDKLPADEPNWPKAVFSGFAATAAAYEQIRALTLSKRRLAKKLASAEAREDELRAQLARVRSEGPAPADSRVSRLRRRLVSAMRRGRVPRHGVRLDSRVREDAKGP